MIKTKRNNQQYKEVKFFMVLEKNFGIMKQLDKINQYHKQLYNFKNYFQIKSHHQLNKQPSPYNVSFLFKLQNISIKLNNSNQFTILNQNRGNLMLLIYCKIKQFIEKSRFDKKSISREKTQDLYNINKQKFNLNNQNQFYNYMRQFNYNIDQIKKNKKKFINNFMGELFISCLSPEELKRLKEQQEYIMIEYRYNLELRIQNRQGVQKKGITHKNIQETMNGLIKEYIQNKVSNQNQNLKPQQILSLIQQKSVIHSGQQNRQVQHNRPGQHNSIKQQSIQTQNQIQQKKYQIININNQSSQNNSIVEKLLKQNHISLAQSNQRTQNLLDIHILTLKNMHDRGGLDLFDSQVNYKFDYLLQLIQRPNSILLIINFSPKSYLTSKVLKQQFIKKMMLFTKRQTIKITSPSIYFLALQYDYLKKTALFKDKSKQQFKIIINQLQELSLNKF